MELHVHFLPGRVNSPGFETLSYQLVANAHILRLCLIKADTLSWGVQRQSNQYAGRRGNCRRSTNRLLRLICHLNMMRGM